MVAKYKDFFHQLLLMIKTFACQLLYLPLLFTSLSAALNLADPEKYPYANPNAGREGYDLAGKTVNEARVYDFYQRQADYYMENPNLTPKIIPAYPGLDAGLHGHWKT